jgi:Cellulase (glycosyl hydrolase family 5)
MDGKSMQRKSSLLAIFSGGLFVFVWTAGLTQRVTAQERPPWFPFNGKTWFLLGANYPWYNGHRGLDLGPYLGSKTIGTVAFAGPRDNPGYGRDLQSPSVPIHTGTTGFNSRGIEAQLQDMQSLGIHVLRWFFGNDGRSFMTLDERETCTGIDSTALQNVDRVLALAEAHQVYLVPVLFDFRFVSGDQWLRFDDGSLSFGHSDVIRSSEKRKSLIENFVQPLVKRCANSKAILYWEIMNEAGNVVQGTDPATGFALGRNAPANKAKVSVVEMQTFLNEVYDAIKSVDQTHPVMPSGLGRPWQLPLVVGRVKADLYGAHYNDNGSDWDRIEPVANISNWLHNRFGLVLNKPLVMTEGPAEVRHHLDAYLQGAFAGGWAGYLAWSYYTLIGFNNLVRYPRIVTSKDGSPLARPNVDLYRRFDQAHEGAVKLGM